jgi:hypothetical protein
VTPAIDRKRRFTRDVLPSIILYGIAALVCFTVLRAIGASISIAALLSVPATVVVGVLLFLGILFVVGYGTAGITMLARRFRHISFIRPLHVRCRAGAIAHARIHRKAGELHEKHSH